MQLPRKSRLSLVAAAAVLGCLALAPPAFPQGVQPSSAAPASTQPPPPNPNNNNNNNNNQGNAGGDQGTPYTAPDGSASVTLPPGWQATSAMQGVIILKGPQPGEAAVLGDRIGAHNGNYVPGQHGTNNTVLTMPYTADFQDKVAMVVDQLQVLNGRPVPTGAVTSVTPIPVPRTLGQCGRFTGNMSSPNGTLLGTGSLCSMLIGDLGDYANILMLVQAPQSESATFNQLAQSILSSYQVQPATLQSLLRPYDQLAGRPTQLMDPTSTQCFNLSVLRATPPAQLPPACGGFGSN